ncbi:hypothetical protein V1511DRAFT_318499 [Dipodascopsis uninucleata]
MNFIQLFFIVFLVLGLRMYIVRQAYIDDICIRCFLIYYDSLILVYFFVSFLYIWKVSNFLIYLLNFLYFYVLMALLYTGLLFWFCFFDELFLYNKYIYIYI